MFFNINFNRNSLVFYSGISFILGAFLSIGLSYNSLVFLALISFIGTTIIFTKVKKMSHRVLIAISNSFGISIFGLYWIFFSINYVLDSQILSLLLFIGFILLYSMFTLPLGLLFSAKNKYLFILVVFFTWGFIELLKYYFLGGFPWLVWALIWDFDIYFQQLAYLIGSFGVSICTIGCFSLFFILIRKDFSKTCKTWVVFSTLLIMILIHLYGYIRINKDIKYSNAVNIQLVSTNVPQNIKFDDRYIEKNLKELINDTFSNIDYNKPPKYIIMPETVIPFSIEYGSKYYKLLVDKLPSDSYLIFGAMKQEGEKVYNVIHVISGKNKQIIATYYKNKLVPFGEYIPLLSWFPSLEQALGLFSMDAGSEHVIFNIDSKDAIFPMVCFEGVFPVPISLGSNISFLLNISNEAWFNNSIENQQYISLLKYRSIEENLPLVKVANQGISVILNSYGEVIYKKTSNSHLVSKNVELLY